METTQKDDTPAIISNNNNSRKSTTATRTSTTIANPIWIEDPETALSYWSEKAEENRRISKARSVATPSTNFQTMEISNRPNGSVDLPSSSSNQSSVDKSNTSQVSIDSKIKVKAEPQPEIELDNSVAFARYIFVGLCVLTVFITTFLSYRKQSTQIIVTDNQLNQCASNQTISSFPSFNGSEELVTTITDDVSNTKAYLGLSSSYYLAAADPLVTFNPKIARGCAYAAPFSNFTKYAWENLTVEFLGTYDGNIFTLSHPCNSTVYGNYVPYWPGNKTPQIRLYCSITATPNTNTYYNLLPTTVNCNSNKDIWISAVVAKQDNSIFASCDFSVCGTPFLFYSESKTIEPSGISECTVYPTTLSSISAAFANGLATSSALMVFTMCSIIIYFLGFWGFIEYAMKGGKLN